MKKALAIILSVLMLLPFVSCSNNPEQPEVPNVPEEPKYACLNRADADGDGVCDKCGGNFKYTEDGIKDCSACMVPHRRKNYDYIMGKFMEIVEVAKNNK